jgi:glycosyltransferase involved in cell wall biosynthesis
LARVDGRQYLLGYDAMRALLSWMEEGGERPRLDLRGQLQLQRDQDLRAAQSLVRKSAIASATLGELNLMLRTHMPDGGHYLNVGHDNLENSAIDAIGAAGLLRIVLMHDAIPLDYPEFGRAGSAPKFRAKLDAAERADLIIANSHHTAYRLRVHGIVSDVPVAPLGIHPQPGLQNRVKQPPVFLALGTIEPRKNHALLLKVWERFWDKMKDASPRLILLGRRGWENEAVFHQLDTAPMMGHTVIEAGTPDDAALAEYFASATALLFPSFAEGYGLPLAEAMDVGLPSIVSDLEALREVGGDVPEYLSPKDAQAWTRTVLSYARPGSTHRIEQLHRMESWQSPKWAEHFAIVENAMETILVQRQADV